MDLAAQKLHIIEQILQIQDEETLCRIEFFLANLTFNWDDLGEKEKASIMRGLEQAQRGEGILHEEMVKLYPQWLSE